MKEFVSLYPEVNISFVCKIYKVARSTLYYKQAQRIQDTITQTKVSLVHIFDPYYGHRRIAYKLEYNKKKVQRIMQKFDIQAYARKRKFRKPGDRNLAHMGVENLKKDISVTETNQLWNSDFTHLYYKEKEFYLATILDEYGKNISGYRIGFRHGKELIIETLKDAIQKTQTTPAILHSDQGSEYRSYEYFDTLKYYNIIPSMSRKSAPWENGGQESFYGKMKFELGNLNRFKTFEEAIEAIHLWIYYYNNERIHTTLKMSPRQFLEKQKSTAKSV